MIELGKGDKRKANQIHYEVGKTVRKAVEKIGGTMPEELPASENIKMGEKKVKKQILKQKKDEE